MSEFLEHYDRLRQFVSSCMPTKLRLETDPDDILQETYTVAWPSNDTVTISEKNEKMRWLRTVARRKLIDRVRHVSRAKRNDGQRPTLHHNEDNINSRVRTPSSFAAQREAAEILEEAIGSLSDRHQSVIRLRFFEGRSFANVADELKLTVPAAQMLTKRAVNKLREALGSGSRFI